MPFISSPKHINLERLSLFRSLSQPELLRVEALLTPVSAKVDTTLLNADEIGPFVYFILSGTVCIYREPFDGARVILNMVGAGETIGEACALDSHGHTATARATEAAGLLRMRRSDFTAFNDTLPQLAKNMNHLLVRRLRFATLHNETLSAREVRVRVARLLCALADRYGAGSSRNCILVPLRLTQSEIAEWICVSRQHASTHLNYFRECGLIEIGKRHRLTILDYQRLSKHCD